MMLTSEPLYAFLFWRDRAQVQFLARQQPSGGEGEVRVRLGLGLGLGLRLGFGFGFGLGS